MFGFARRFMYFWYFFCATRKQFIKEYSSAYKYSIKFSRYSRSNDVFGVLVRSYYALLSGHEEDCYASLKVFYSLALDEDVVEYYRYTQDEWDWLFLFSEYIWCAVSGKWVGQIVSDNRLLSIVPGKINFDNIRDLHKSIFHPGHIPEIQRAIGKYRR